MKQLLGRGPEPKCLGQRLLRRRKAGPWVALLGTVVITVMLKHDDHFLDGEVSSVESRSEPRQNKSGKSASDMGPTSTQDILDNDVL